jgi:ABC-type microcin C transport system permease subunit YejB
MKMKVYVVNCIDSKKAKNLVQRCMRYGFDATQSNRFVAMEINFHPWDFLKGYIDINVKVWEASEYLSIYKAVKLHPDY